MKYKNLILVTSFILYFGGIKNAKAQEIKPSTKNNNWLLKAEYYKPKGIVDFANATKNGFHYPSNFGVSIGAERNYTKSKKWRNYQSGTIGFYNHSYFERVATLETALGTSFTIWKGLNIGSEYSVGYNYARSSHLVSEFINDKWVSKVDLSVITHRFTTGLGANIGYDLGKHFNKVPITLNLAYNLVLLTPFDKRSNTKFNLYHQPRLSLKWALK